MSSKGSLQTAYLEVLDGEDAGERIKLMFNPQEARITERVGYSEHEMLLNNPFPQFKGGKVTRVQILAFFDTSKSKTDVREYTKPIDRTMKVDGQLHAPPPCRFVWGGGLNFKCRLTKGDKRFTRFKKSGKPERAWYDMTMKKYKRPETQKSEIKHESTDKQKLWTVSEGETLMLIAEEEYGDRSHWRTIARANDVDNPRRLETGTKLSLPPL